MSDKQPTIKQRIFNELETLTVKERQIQQASAFNVKEPALALAKSQRRLNALMVQCILNPELLKDSENGK